MAAGLSIAAARVEGPAGLIAERAQVLVRGNVLTVRGGGILDTFDGVQAVEQTTRGQWRIRFPDASEIVVTRAAGCGCGGRRR